MSIQAPDILGFSRKIMRVYSHVFELLMQEYGLTMREIHILLFLINHPDLNTARDICQHRGLLKSQVSQGVEILCEKSILQRKFDSQDRRIVHLCLTETGIPIAKRGQELQNQWWVDLMANFNPSEQAQAQHLIQKLVQVTNTLEELI